MEFRSAVDVRAVALTRRDCDSGSPTRGFTPVAGLLTFRGQTPAVELLTGRLTPVAGLLTWRVSSCTLICPHPGAGGRASRPAVLRAPPPPASPPAIASLALIDIGPGLPSFRSCRRLQRRNGSRTILHDPFQRAPPSKSSRLGIDSTRIFGF
jgi:hypothetical protein